MFALQLRTGVGYRPPHVWLIRLLTPRIHGHVVCPADPCEAASMPLRGALVRGTARLLRPSAFHYSPAVGLIASASSHLAANLLHAERLVDGPLCCGYGPALELSRELLHEPAEGDVRLAAG